MAKINLTPFSVPVGLLLLLCCGAATAGQFEIRAPAVVHTDVPFSAEMMLVDGREPPPIPLRATVMIGGQVAGQLAIDGSRITLDDLRIADTGRAQLRVSVDGEEIAVTDVHAIPGWTSLLPPLVAIGIALWLRTVIPAIFLGVWIGVIARGGFEPRAFLVSLPEAFHVDVLQAIADADHAAVLLFTCMIGGMVGIVARNGGMQGMVAHVLRWADNPRRGQLSVWFLGLAVFFDDYTNTLVVGNTARPVTDRLRISREKLAYLVDSTAAPVACIALVTTWIGYEVGLIADAVAGLPGYDEGAYVVFLNSIPYSFYPVLAILFVFLIAWTGRDFGPMAAAEQRARDTGQVKPVPRSLLPADETGIDMNPPAGIPLRAVNAVLPVTVLILGSIGGMYLTGEGDSVQAILGSADAYAALMWGSLLSVVAAAVLTLAQRIMNLHDLVTAWTRGVNVMVSPLVILVLAWALSGITGTIGTAEFLVRIAGEFVSPGMVPAVTFVIAALSAFATGTSWGVMAILLPIFVPVAWSTLAANGMADPTHYHVIYSTVASILGGSVWGDHCSPISDTTVLSSLASDCDHIEHVRTQLPYALIVGGVALVLGIIPTAFGLPWWIAMPLCAAMLVLAVRFLGTRTGDSSP